MQDVLKDNKAYDPRITLKFEEFDNKNAPKGFIQTYLIKNPKTSRVSWCWDIIWLIVLIIDFTLIPYTICTNVVEVLSVTKIVEVTIDCLWLIQVGMSFTTGFFHEVDLITDIKKIAIKYMKEAFIIDLVTSLPTLLSFYTVPDLYYIKLLRMYHISKATTIIKNQIMSLESRLNVSKQTIYQINYFANIFVQVTIMMHFVSCFWLYIG